MDQKLRTKIISAQNQILLPFAVRRADRKFNGIKKAIQLDQSDIFTCQWCGRICEGDGDKVKQLCEDCLQKERSKV
jgi:rubrerythrin